MNTNNVVSLDAASDLRGSEYSVVKLTSTGVALCASTDTPIGTLVRAQPTQEDGVYAGKSVAVQLLPGSIHYVKMGAGTGAVAKAAGVILDSGTPGRVIPGESGPIARTVQAFTSTPGGVVQVIFL